MIVSYNEGNQHRRSIEGAYQQGSYAAAQGLPVGSLERATPADVADFEQHIARLIAGAVEPDRSHLASFLRANPGCTVRDWKGKGPSIPLDGRPWDQPWHKLKPGDVREQAVASFARELPQNVRQAASRDPALIWNSLGRKYRLRARQETWSAAEQALASARVGVAASAPQAPTSDPTEREGVSKSFGPGTIKTGANPDCDCKPSIPASVSAALAGARANNGEQP